MVPEPSAKPATATSDDRDGTSGWKAPADHSGVARAVDRLVLPAGWNVVDKGSSHESGQNPSSTATDRPASGWKGVQR
jgi:hypothetical protein